MVETRSDHCDRAPTGNRRRWLMWLAWLVVTGVCASGLQHYRIDNDLSQWAPHLRASGPIKSYAVVGFEQANVDEQFLAQQLRTLPSVALCVDRSLVMSGGNRFGVSADQFVIGRDKAYAGIFLFPRELVSDDQFVGEIRGSLAEFGSDPKEIFNLGGPAVFHLALNRASQQRLPFVMLLILVLGGALLRWITGSLRTALEAIAAISLSQIAFLGMMSWLSLPMDMSLSMIPPLMMSFGFSYAAHRSLRPGVTAVLLLCVLTTAIGFGAFLFADVPPIRMFAIASMIGLVVVWLAVVTLVTEPSPESKPASDDIHGLTGLGVRCRLVASGRPRFVIAVATLLTMAAAMSIRYVRIETDPLNYFTPDDPLVKDFAEMNERLTGMLSIQWTFDGDADPMPMISDVPEIRKVIDFSSVVADGRRHYWCLADNESLPVLVTVNESLQRWAAERNVQIRWQGVGAQLGEVERILTDVAAGSLPAMGLVAAMIIGLLGKSIRVGSISLWVNLLPIGALLVLAALLGWRLDLPSLMIGAIAVGVAVDDTLHITESYRRSGNASEAISSCFSPCAGSSLVAAACLFCFAISPFGPVRQFGVLLALAVIFASCADLLLLPSLLTVWPKH